MSDGLLCSPISFKHKHVLCVAPHPDDDVIGCGALLYYLATQSALHRPASITIGYATSGFNGVSDAYLRKHMGKELAFSFEAARVKKSHIRREEAQACCSSIGARASFWDLPFYEARQKTFSLQDVNIVVQCVQELAPDIIVLVDESNDPHGTHGLVQAVCMEALKQVNFLGAVLGYRVWNGGYEVGDCDALLAFGQSLMDAKERLVSFHISQIEDPAFPHDQLGFIELMNRDNKNMARVHNLHSSYAECYKILRGLGLVG